MVTDAAALAGINLIHRMRLTLPPEKKILVGRCMPGRIPNTASWSTARRRSGSGSAPARPVRNRSDVTEWYLALRR